MHLPKSLERTDVSYGIHKSCSAATFAISVVLTSTNTVKHSLSTSAP